MRKVQFEDVKYILSKVGEISIFHYLTVDQKWKLLNICEVFEYEPGEKITTEGETGTCFYAILSGTVNITVNDSNSGKEIFIAATGAGDFFGEAGIFNDIKRTATVSAVDTTEILCIPRDNFFNYVNGYASAGVKILMLFVNGLLKKLYDSNKELAFVRRDVMDQTAIDYFLQNLTSRESRSENFGERGGSSRSDLDNLSNFNALIPEKPGPELFYHVCGNCGGSGITADTSCPECTGRGIIPTNLALQFLDFMNVWNMAQFKKR
jgi:CRP-like cAMP-binding protein